MNVRITRPVVVFSTVGLRHFAPGVMVSVSDEEGAQILRQHAGIEEGLAVDVESRKTKAKGKTKGGGKDEAVGVRLLKASRQRD